MNNSIKSFVDFCETARGVYEVHGDSTVQRNGGGHDEAFGLGVMGLSNCPGQLIPVNSTSAYNDTMGLIHSRRNYNVSTIIGVINDIVVDSAAGYPVNFKQFGCQVPVPASTGYCGAQVAYMAGTVLSGAIDSVTAMTGSTTLTVGDTSACKAGTQRFTIDDEIFQRTGKTATTFTGVSRAQLGTAAANHADGSVIGECENGPAFSGLLDLGSHPIGSGAQYVCSLWYMSVLNTTATPCAKASLEIIAQTSMASATSLTNLAFDASPQVLGSAGYAKGSVHVIDSPVTSSTDLTNTVKYRALAFGTAKNHGNGLGPSGPAAFMMTGVFAKNRPTGLVQGCGISQGGTRLIEMLGALRNYDTANSVCEFDAGFLTRFKYLYLDATIGISGSARGGNGKAGLFVLIASMNNETAGSSVYPTGLPDPTEPWTVKTTTSISGGTAVTNNSTSAITLPPGVAATLPTVGVLRLQNEFIKYTNVVGDTVAGTITRGLFGSIPVAHADGSAVYQGYLIQNPYGHASVILYYYNFLYATWLAAGGGASTFWFGILRPFPVSASPVAVADDTVIRTSGTLAQQYAEREYKLQRFMAIVTEKLSSRPCVVLIDPSKQFKGSDALNLDLGVSSGDQVHLADATMVREWHKLVAADVYASPQPTRVFR